MRLAFVPDERPALEATNRLRERANLLLWLAPTLEFRNALGSILSQIEIRFSDTLQVHAEITEFEPPVRSPASSAAAFYDFETSILHIRTDEGQPVNWEIM